MILNLYKNRGETPLECIQRYRDAHIELKNEKFTYLGRLDPLAEGVLLVASGEDVHRKEEFLNLDKEYEFISVFGFATDTFDIMGKILRVEKVENINELELIKLAEIYKGKREQKYPFYSSKTISKGGNKKQLHELARQGVLDEDDLPTNDIEIYDLKFEGLTSLSSKEFFGRLLMDISKVKGDFRQHEILVLWKKLLDSYNHPILLARWRAKVSSGTYIRSLVNDMGNTLGVGAVVLSIKRNKVGEFDIIESEK